MRGSACSSSMKIIKSLPINIASFRYARKVSFMNTDMQSLGVITRRIETRKHALASASSIHTSHLPSTKRDSTQSFEFWDDVHQLCSLFNNPQRAEETIPRIIPNHFLKALEIIGATPEDGLEFFKWVDRIPSYSHNVESYLAIINILVSSNRFSDVRELTMTMIQKHGHTQENIKHMVESLIAMEGNGVYRIYKTVFLALLKYMARLGLPALSWKLYSHMLARGFKPGYCALDSMVDVFCKKGMVAEASMFFAVLLKEKCWPPDFYTFTQLICGHCRAGSIEEALRIFDIMKRLGSEPTCVTYSVLIDGLSRKGKLNDAFELIGEMVAKNITPNARTFNGLLACLCDAGRVEEAFDFIKKMENLGCNPDVHVYSILVTGLCRQGKMVDAREVFDKITELGLAPTVVSYNALIDGYCKNAEIDKAFEIMSTMEKNGCLPNVRTYTELIHGLCLLGRLEEAEMLLLKMREKGVNPNVVTYTCLIDGCKRLERLDDGFRLLADMMTNGLAPCYRILCPLMDCVVQGKGMQAGEMRESLWHHVTTVHILVFLAKMSEHGCEPTVDMYRILITRLCELGKLFEANRLIWIMLDKGILPDKAIVTAVKRISIEIESSLEGIIILKELTGKKNAMEDYECLILRIFREGDVIVAMRLFESALLKGYVPNQDTWSMFFDSLLQNNETDMCLRCFKLLQKIGLQHPEEMYKALVSQLAREGKTSEADSLVNKTTKRRFVL